MGALVALQGWVCLSAASLLQREYFDVHMKAGGWMFFRRKPSCETRKKKEGKTVTGRREGTDVILPVPFRGRRF